MSEAEIDRRALGRELTALTDATVARVLELRRHDHPLHPRRAHRIGITGPPGAGKSSLVGALFAYRLRYDRSTAVVAIDPTSPHSGGSLLGDRIRIDAVVADDHLYVRSVPSRTAVDGTTDNLPDILAALERQPFDELVVETVGVGQADYGVRCCVDTMVVCVVPGAGDTIQAMKAGILEVGDVYVVHKADQDGAERAASELSATLSARPDSAWQPPVLLTSAVSGQGIVELSDAIDVHHDHLADAGEHQRRCEDRARYDVERLVARRVREVVGALLPEALEEPLPARFSRVIEELAASAIADCQPPAATTGARR